MQQRAQPIAPPASNAIVETRDTPLLIALRSRRDCTRIHEAVSRRRGFLDSAVRSSASEARVRAMIAPSEHSSSQRNSVRPPGAPHPVLYERCCLRTGWPAGWLAALLLVSQCRADAASRPPSRRRTHVCRNGSLAPTYQPSTSPPCSTIHYRYLVVGIPSARVVFRPWQRPRALKSRPSLLCARDVIPQRCGQPASAPRKPSNIACAPSMLMAKSEQRGRPEGMGQG